MLISCVGQLTTGKEVAVKTCASDAMNPDSFMKEVRFMTALNHAHIVKLYGVCTRHNTEMFIVTELMANGDLRHYLMNDAGDKIHLPELLSFAEQVTVFMAFCRLVIVTQHLRIMERRHVT